MFLDSCNKVNSSSQIAGEGGQQERREMLEKRRQKRGSQLDKPKFKSEFVKPNVTEDLE